MKKYNTWLLILLLVLISGLTVLSTEKQISAMDILKELGINEVSITEDAPVGDLLVENPVTRIDFNDTSYVFLDEDDAIIRIERVDEIRDLYTQNVSAETYESSFESVDELIDYIETYIIGEEYILTKEGHFDWKTLVLRYEKKLSNGALDNYDTYSVYIDEQYTEITSLHKRTADDTEQETKSTLTISSAKAIEIAEVILGEEMIYPKIEVEFATVKTNTCFDESVIPNEIKIAYIVKTDSTHVYVDAYTGEIIGGEIMKVF